MVLDCFAGSGTTAAAAHKMGRHWIACDISYGAVQTMRRRMQRIVEEIGPGFTVHAAGRLHPNSPRAVRRAQRTSSRSDAADVHRPRSDRPGLVEIEIHDYRPRPGVAGSRQAQAARIEMRRRLAALGRRGRHRHGLRRQRVPRRARGLAAAASRPRGGRLCAGRSSRTSRPPWPYASPTSFGGETLVTRRV